VLLLVCVFSNSIRFEITPTSQLAYDLHLYEALDALNLQFGILLLKFCPYSTRCDLDSSTTTARALTVVVAFLIVFVSPRSLSPVKCSWPSGEWTSRFSLPSSIPGTLLLQQQQKPQQQHMNTFVLILALSQERFQSLQSRADVISLCGRVRSRLAP
jgi:hypothetical protein